MGRLKELQERGGLAAAAAAAAAASSGSDIDSRELDNSHQYTSRNTGQPVAMDLCVVCGDRASGESRNTTLVISYELEEKKWSAGSGIDGFFFMKLIK